MQTAKVLCKGLRIVEGAGLVCAPTYADGKKMMTLSLASVAWTLVRLRFAKNSG